MRLVLLLCIMSVVCSEKPKDKINECESSEKHEVLADGLNRPYQLSYYKKEHLIFYSNNVGDDKDDRFEIRCLHKLEPKNNEKIEGVNNGFATAIDEENDIAYLGGSDGVYLYDLKNKKLEKIIDHHNIWHMFFKKHLYFITYPHQQLYKYEHNNMKTEHGKKHKETKAIHENWINEQIFQFAIDGEDNVFFTNRTGLYMTKYKSENRTHIMGETTFRCISINNKGIPYFCGKNAIFTLNKSSFTLHETHYVKNIFGLAFDSGDFIMYSNPLAIMKVVPSNCLLPVINPVLPDSVKIP